MRSFPYASAAVVVAVGACSSPSPPTISATGDAGSAPDGSTASRAVSGRLTFDANGISSTLSFDVPERTRSLTVIVEGDPTRLYALAGFTPADGPDLVGVDPTKSHAAEMRRSYFDEQIGAMSGPLRQSIRLGTFTHVYPYAPGQRLVAGAATLRIATDGAQGSATVTVMMPEDDGASVLHINVVRLSETEEMSAPPPFLEELRAIYAPAGLDVVVDEVVTLRGTGYARVASFSEPQESPHSESAELAVLVGPMTKSTGLDVVIVDSLPPGVAGLSLGVPGPPVPGSYYYGVVVADAPAQATLARVVAHELGHFLGLQHVRSRGASGTVYDDGLDDTMPLLPNLMTNGTDLTPGQIFVLGRSSLLLTK